MCLVTILFSFFLFTYTVSVTTWWQFNLNVVIVITILILWKILLCHHPTSSFSCVYIFLLFSFPLVWYEALWLNRVDLSKTCYYSGLPINSVSIFVERVTDSPLCSKHFGLSRLLFLDSSAQDSVWLHHMQDCCKEETRGEEMRTLSKWRRYIITNHKDWFLSYWCWSFQSLIRTLSQCGRCSMMFNMMNDRSSTYKMLLIHKMITHKVRIVF